VLEARGWSPERIKERLGPSRRVFAMSWFMQRCQEWPRGYAGDFETIEYMVSGANQSFTGTLGWHIENILLESPVVQQHRNKLKRQSLEIAKTVMRSRTARLLSIGCGGCMDWVPILPDLKTFAGEIVLNDHEPAALELAEYRLRPVTTQYRLAPGNVIRISKRLAGGDCFDLVLAGGLFDYLSDRATVCLVRTIFQDLLAPGGVLLFTNMAEGNPWRLLMEYGSDWSLIERSEYRILDICRQAGIPRSSISLTREAAQLTVITRVVR
jgi:SAM-dependent methyltransferase